MPVERIIFSVGQPLNVKPQCEGYMHVLNGPSFDIIAFYSNLTQQSIVDWLQGKILHGVVVERSIPIFIIDLGEFWSKDIFLNILLEDEDLQRKFFEEDPDQTTMHLTLVSYSDSLIQGIRTIAGAGKRRGQNLLEAGLIGSGREPRAAKAKASA